MVRLASLPTTRARRPCLTRFLALLAAAAPLTAQVDQKPPERATPPPIDEAARAAELLRRRLGLKPGGIEPPPARPETALPPPPGPRLPTPSPTPPRGGERPQAVSPFDPARAAAEALRRLLPEAERVQVAPMPEGHVPDRVAGPALPGATSRSAPAVEPTAGATRSLADAPAEPAGIPVHGSLSARYRLRRTDGASDQEMVSVLTIDAGDPDRHPITGHFFGRGYADLDGVEPDGRLRGIEDSFDRAVTGRLYDAYLDYHRLPHAAVVRLGRQHLDDTPVPLHFDGLRVETDQLGDSRLWLAAYGGVPVHLFEASARGDRLVGVAAGAAPWSGGRLRADWLYLRDRLFTSERSDALFGVSFWQGVGTWGETEVRHTRIDGDGRDLSARFAATAGSGAWRSRLQVTYDELLTAQRQRVTELDPFFESLFDWFPYRQLGVRLNQELGEHASLGGGVVLRRLRRSADRDTTNREFDRYWLRPELRGLAGGGLALGLNADWWYADGQRIATLGGDATLDLTDGVSVSAGSTYFLYRFDAFSGTSRDRVRVHSIDLRAELADGLRANLRYAFEDTDLDPFHVFTASMTWSF